MTARFTVTATSLEGLAEIERLPIGDARGYLERMFCDVELQSLVGFSSIAQVNRTLTRHRGTVRGMHFQHAPHGEAKVVSCLRGEVFDVAVDLRRGSPTFLRWHGTVLSADNHRSLVIPQGFAHGFQTLAEDCELLYFHSRRHAPAAEGALNAVDPAIAIAWPAPIGFRSPRDESHPLITPDFRGIEP
jgi:dTDP-4-dehydrorhamnose 3,5-epimerase